MRITISGKNIELTEGLKQAVEEKLSKLEKFFKPDTDVYVTLSVEKDRQKIEVTIPAKGHVIRSEQVSNDMYVSIGPRRGSNRETASQIQNQDFRKEVCTGDIPG